MFVNAAGAVPQAEPTPLAAGPNLQEGARAAWDGTNYLVVWSDLRDGLLGWDVYGMRVSPSGAPVDARAFAIAKTTTDEQSPAVAWNGHEYLVAWHSIDGIFAERVDASGALLDGTSRQLDVDLDPSTPSSPPAVASDSLGWFVVWSRHANGYDVYGARVSGGGTVLDSPAIPISAMPLDDWSPRIAWAGSSYLVTWVYGALASPPLQGVFGARVDANGNLLDAPGFGIVPSAAQGTDVGFDGTDALVLASGAGLAGARVAMTGQVVDATPFPLGPTTASAASIASTTTGYLVGWDDSTSGSAYEHVANDGTRLDPAPVSIAPTATHIALAGGGDGGLAAYQIPDGPTAVPRVRARVVQTSAGASTIGPELTLDPPAIGSIPALGDQSHVNVASNGSIMLAVWLEPSADAASLWSLRGARVTQSGALLDPNDGFVIATTATLAPAPSYTGAAPGVASDGTDFLVAWSDGRDATGIGARVYAARVTADGLVVDTSGIPLSPAGAGVGASQPAVTRAASEWFVVWRDARDAASDASAGADLYGARLQPDGSVTDPGGTLVARANADVAFPSVASDGTGFFVAWLLASGDCGDGSVYGARVAADGSALDSAGIRIAACGGRPNVTWAGTSYAVTWANITAPAATDAGLTTSPDAGSTVATDAGTAQGATAGPPAGGGCACRFANPEQRDDAGETGLFAAALATAVAALRRRRRRFEVET
jgi:hypothetical protein